MSVLEFLNVDSGENRLTGIKGEEEVVGLIKCPNCGKSLMLLPPGYPLYDVQCTGCIFRAQVKTVNSKPKSEILGAGWEIMEKVLKSGYTIPPLIANFHWSEKEETRHEIRFYPFIPKISLKKYQLSPSAHRANYKMFRYTDLSKIPHFTWTF
ncbi:MAG: DpnI domain-containing protein [Candidatus Levyibacteriota bacterium]